MDEPRLVVIKKDQIIRMAKVSSIWCACIAGVIAGVLAAVLIAPIASKILSSRNPSQPQSGTAGEASQATTSIPAMSQGASQNVLVASPAASQNVLVLPRAAHEFLGPWFGLLKLKQATGDRAAPTEREAGLRFVLRNDEIAVDAAVYGSDRDKVIESSGEVLDPNHVKLKYESLLEPLNGDESVWATVEADVALTGKELQWTETDRYSEAPGVHPYKTLVYRGTLKPITEAEIRAWSEQKKEQGLEPRADIHTESR